MNKVLKLLRLFSSLQYSNTDMLTANEGLQKSTNAKVHQEYDLQHCLTRATLQGRLLIFQLKINTLIFEPIK